MDAAPTTMRERDARASSCARPAGVQSRNRDRVFWSMMPGTSRYDGVCLSLSLIFVCDRTDTA